MSSDNFSNQTTVDNIIKEILGSSSSSLSGGQEHQNGVEGGLSQARRNIMYQNLRREGYNLGGGQTFDAELDNGLEGGKKSKTAWMKLVMKNYKKIRSRSGKKDAFKKALKMSKKQYRKRSK